jgi:hypothetical protein
MRNVFTVLPALLLALSGCAPSPTGGQDGNLAQSAPLASPSPETDSRNIDPALPTLPPPAIGSVVITNTTATPVSSSASASALTPDSALQGLTQQAKEDLAKRLNIDINQIDLLKIVPDKWPYDSPGCPSAGTENTGANKTGYQILLTADGHTYMYHTDGKDSIGLCVIKPPDEIRTLP